MRTPTTGRYDPREIALRVERAREGAGLSVKELADKAGVGVWAWYKRGSGDTPFTVEELGRIADILDAPLGWPFLPWEMGETLSRRLR